MKRNKAEPLTYRGMTRRRIGPALNTTPRGSSPVTQDTILLHAGRRIMARSQPLTVSTTLFRNALCSLITATLLCLCSTAEVHAQDEVVETTAPGSSEFQEEVRELEEEELMQELADGPRLEGANLESMPQESTGEEELVNLNLNKQDVTEIIEFIVRWTGKVVMVQEQAILSRKITVMSEKKVPKETALEILYQAFKLNDIAVVETDTMIMIDSINDVSSLQPGVVLGPEVDVELLDDDGNIVIKVFQIQEAKAQDIYDRLDPSKPEYARLTVDVNSN